MMTKQNDIPQVEAPVVAPPAKDDKTVWDTQKFKAMLNKVTQEIVITPKETPDETALKQQWLLEYRQIQQQKNAIQNASKQPYILMVLGMVALVVISIVLLETLSPITRDNTASIAQIVGFAATTTAALFAYQKSQDTHVMVNSRLSQWMEKAEAAAAAEGKEEGRKAANERTDLLAETNKPKQ